jgi:hypothetical protein
MLAISACWATVGRAKPTLAVIDKQQEIIAGGTAPRAKIAT